MLEGGVNLHRGPMLQWNVGPAATLKGMGCRPGGCQLRLEHVKLSL